MNRKANVIYLKHSIIISRDYKTVFNYISDYTNDKNWRKPIHQTTMNTAKPEQGTIITEDCFLSRKVPHFITTFRCLEFIPNKTISSESTPENQFWSSNTREVEAIDNFTTKVTYTFQLDISIVKHAFGFSLPVFLVNMSTKAEIRAYLKKLKQVLEKL